MDQLLALRAFSRVVEAGNFTRAADSLGMPKATVSKLVQQLEAHLGVQLLTRTTRRVAVTAEGTAYHAQTARVLKDLDDADASFTSAQSRPRGHLRVDVGSSIASRILIPALPRFTVRFPDIRVDLGVSDRDVDLVGDHVDCVIRGGPVTDTALVSRLLARAAWTTCATPAYLARSGTPRHPRDLADHRVVAYLSARTGRALPMRFVDGRGHSLEPPIRHAIGVNESNAHFAAGLAGLGIVQTFAFLAQGALARGELVALLPRFQPPPYPLRVAYPPNRHVSHRLRLFIDWLVEEFASVP